MTTVDEARAALLEAILYHNSDCRGSWLDDFNAVKRELSAFEAAIRAEYEDADRWGRAVHDTFCHLRRPMHSDSRHSADELVAAFARLVAR